MYGGEDKRIQTISTLKSPSWDPQNLEAVERKSEEGGDKVKTIVRELGMNEMFGFQLAG